MRASRFRLLFALVLLALGVAGGGAGLFLLAESEQRSGATESTGEISHVKFEDAQGNTVSLADFRGKTILLNVWATWCAPCRKEMPSLDRLQVELGGSDFEVVPLSIDRTGFDAVRPFFTEIGIKTLNIYLDRPAAIIRTAGILGLPTTLLLDGDGRELRRWVGPKEWDSAESIEEIRSHLKAGAKSISSQ